MAIAMNRKVCMGERVDTEVKGEGRCKGEGEGGKHDEEVRGGNGFLAVWDPNILFSSSSRSHGFVVGRCGVAGRSRVQDLVWPRL
jgi:hypothetical protein